jgi:hypothetical protein
MTTSSDFPAPIRLNGRLVWDRFEIENHKRRLLGLPPLERDPQGRLCSSRRSNSSLSYRSAGARSVIW